MRYILNALPGGALIGRSFIGRPATADDLIAAIDGGAMSAIGHAATAEALSTLLGRPIAAARVTVVPQAGDVLFVAALRGPRLAEGQVLSREEVLARGFDFLAVTITA
jgi:hypothetical protein